MLTIWKYEIPLFGEAFALRMPEKPGLLTVQMQHEHPRLWALVDTEHPYRLYRFRIFSTGQPIPDDKRLCYLGTFQLPEAGLVYHIFFCLEDATT